MRTIWILAAVLVLAAGVADDALAQQSIVGKWAVRGQCSKPLSVVQIEPMGLGGEDYYCEFGKVSRKGDTVNWAGRCNFSENGWEKSTATAQLRGQRLYYRFGGQGWNGPFDRCAK